MVAMMKQQTCADRVGFERQRVSPACGPITGDVVLDVARAFCAAPDVAELRDVAQAFLVSRGFAGFTFAVVRRVKSMTLHARLLHSWPDTAQRGFERRGMLQNDPVILASRTAMTPFVWDLSIYDPAQPEHAPLLELRRSLGITGGICVPVFEAHQGRSVLYLSGDRFDASEQTQLCLQLIAQHLSNRLNALSHTDGGRTIGQQMFMTDATLSPRERQVFGWIAFGKSSREIATIMSISEHTVNDYIASAVDKLQASNRAEALMRALLTNQIDLI
jgi:LuxR family quorum sensing-dependent transcriptional regulator